MDWNRLIQPLGQGSFDSYGFVLDTLTYIVTMSETSEVCKTSEVFEVRLFFMSKAYFALSSWLIGNAINNSIGVIRHQQRTIVAQGQTYRTRKMSRIVFY